MNLRQVDIGCYGCIKQARLALTPLHALIGPNDSGKSTILHALRSAQSLVGQAQTVDPYFTKGTDLAMRSDDDGTYHLHFHGDSDYTVHFESFAPGQISFRGSGPVTSHPELRSSFRPGSAHLLRLDPDRLRAPSDLLPDSAPTYFADERGYGLPAVYDHLINKNVQGFLEIVEDVRHLFPSVRKLQLRNVDSRQKSIEVELTTGTKIAAEFMSEGLLYYLAFAVLKHLDSARMLLVEEPENGLHPARIKEVVQILRAISQRTPVVLATHSPLVVNELEADEVSVVTRTIEDGTLVRPIAETPNFKRRSEVYALGELWLSYANGDDEAPLFHDSTVSMDNA